MKTRQLLILLITAVVIGGAALLLMRREQSTWEPPAELDDSDRKAFPGLDPNAVAAISITGRDESVELERNEDGIWVVASSHGYPADFSKLAPVVRTLDDLELTQMIEAGEDDYGRLNLIAPDAEAPTDEQGTHVQLRDAEGTVLANFILGRQHQSQPVNPQMPMMGGSQGRYVRILEDNRVALVKESFWNLRAENDAWLDKTFIKFEGKMQRAVARKGDETLWELRREDKAGKLQLVGDIPEGHEANTTKIDNVDRALNYPRFTSVGDPGKSPADFGLDEPRRFVADSFDGWHYELAIGDKTDDGGYPVTVGVSYTPPPAPPAPEDETPEAREQRESEHAETVKEAEEKAARLRRRLDGWVYILPSYTAEDLLYEREDLLREVEKEEDEAATEAAPPAPAPEPVEVEPVEEAATDLDEVE